MSARQPYDVDFDAIQAWTGRWRWNPATHTFDDGMATAANGGVWKEQIQTIEVKGSLLSIRNDQLFIDDSRRTWLYEGAFDGRPYPIRWTDDQSIMNVISFMLIDKLRGADAYFPLDSSYGGSEYFILNGDNVKVWGAMTVAGRSTTYYEEWDRI